MADVLSALTKKKLGVSEKAVDPAEKAAFQKGAATLGSLENRLQKKAEYQQADAEEKLSIAMQELEKTRDREMGTGEIVAKSLIALAPLLGYAVRTKGGEPSYATGAIIGQASQTALKGIDEAIERERSGKEEQAKTKLSLAIERSKEAQRSAREEPLKAKELELKERGMRLQEKEAAMPGPEKMGKPLTAEQAKSIAGFQSSEDQLTGIEKEIEKNVDVMGPAAGRLFGASPYATEAKKFDARMKLAAQKIGVALEGGKLTDEDISRYRQMLPNLTDTPDVARGKIAIVRELLASERSALLQSMGLSGFDVSRFKEPTKQQAQPQSVEKPTRVVQNGIEYRLNPATGKYE